MVPWGLKIGLVQVSGNHDVSTDRGNKSKGFREWNKPPSPFDDPEAAMLHADPL